MNPPESQAGTSRTSDQSAEQRWIITYTTQMAFGYMQPMGVGPQFVGVPKVNAPVGATLLSEKVSVKSSGGSWMRPTLPPSRHQELLFELGGVALERCSGGSRRTGPDGEDWIDLGFRPEKTIRVGSRYDVRQNPMEPFQSLVKAQQAYEQTMSTRLESLPPGWKLRLPLTLRHVAYEPREHPVRPSWAWPSIAQSAWPQHLGRYVMSATWGNGVCPNGTLQAGQAQLTHKVLMGSALRGTATELERMLQRINRLASTQQHHLYPDVAQLLVGIRVESDDPADFPEGSIERKRAKKYRKASRSGYRKASRFFARQRAAVALVFLTERGARRGSPPAPYGALGHGARWNAAWTQAAQKKAARAHQGTTQTESAQENPSTTHD